MHLVNEQHVTRAQVRENRGEVAGTFDGGARSRSDGHLHFVGDDVRERRLAQARRTVQQDVVNRFAARTCGLEQDAQVLFYLVLPNVLGESFGTQR